MGEKKTTLLEINIEDAGGFAFSPHLGGEFGEKLEEYEEKGSELGLFGSEEGTVEEDEEAESESSSGLFSRGSDGETDADVAEAEEPEETEVEIEDAEDAEADEDSGGSLGLVIGLLFLLVVAAVAKKVVVDGGAEEYEEVELSEYES